MSASPAPISPLPVLLRRPAHQSTLPPSSRDFQVRVGHPAAAGGGTPCVAVFTRTADREIDELSLRLAAAGIALVRFDSDRCSGERLSFDLADDTVTTSAGTFRPQVCWLRYFTAPSIAPAADPVVDSYARDQWLPWAAALLAGPRVRVVNPVAAPDRVGQLVQARAVGLRTPPTVVTTTPQEAAQHIPGDGDLLVKALGEHFVEPVPGRLTGLAPRRMSRSALREEAGVEPAPVLVQEFIPSHRELRIYAVGDRMLAFAVTRPSPEALWTRPGELSAAPVPVPPMLERRLRYLLAHWRLDVAAFDFLDTPQGPVFLEVNGACDWLWCEHLAGTRTVSAAVHEHVAALFHG
jgi:hypothetical protein